MAPRGAARGARVGLVVVLWVGSAGAFAPATPGACGALFAHLAKLAASLVGAASSQATPAARSTLARPLVGPAWARMGAASNLVSSPPTAPLASAAAPRGAARAAIAWLLRDGRKIAGGPQGLPFPIGVKPTSGGGTVTVRGSF